MTRPLVSVAAVSYNQREFVREALVSALEQDYDALEVVVADDHSTDGTVEIIGELASRYAGRLVPVLGGSNVGITKNTNRAMQRCRGTYVAFLGCDDVLLPGKIKAQVEWMEADPRRVLCGHDVEAFESGTGRTLYRWSERFRLRHGAGAHDAVKFGVPFCGSSNMVRASAMPAEGYDERIVWISDWKFWIDCLAAGGHYGHVGGVLARYRIHADNVTGSRFQIRQDEWFTTIALVESAHPELAGCCRVARAKAFGEAAIRHLTSGDRAAARGCFAAAARSSTRIAGKAVAGLALTMLPSALSTRALRWYVGRKGSDGYSVGSEPSSAAGTGGPRR